MVNDLSKPGPYAHLVDFVPTYQDIETVGRHDHLCDADERTITDEDMLAAVSWEWSEDVCKQYYANLNI